MASKFLYIDIMPEDSGFRRKIHVEQEIKNMQLIQSYVSEAVAGFKNMLFPGVCLSCGQPSSDGSGLLCPFCQEEKFDKANPFDTLTCPGVILPDGVKFQFAMWKYDKGGVLQRLLHNIKYSGLGRLGYELGSLTGKAMKDCDILQNLINSPESCALLPVPLHPRRKRMRGFNQAEVIAIGISDVTGVPILEESVVVRKTHTTTQTGFSILERTRNLEGVFVVGNQSELKSKLVIIVDDVFTTGATTYSLASTIMTCEPEAIGIVTIAYA
jgi:ComF family protein